MMIPIVDVDKGELVDSIYKSLERNYRNWYSPLCHEKKDGDVYCREQVYLYAGPSLECYKLVARKAPWWFRALDRFGFITHTPVEYIDGVTYIVDFSKAVRVDLSESEYLKFAALKQRWLDEEVKRKENEALCALVDYHSWFL